MATKASAQVTLTDITDAYTVYLTANSYTFPGSTTGAIAGSCTTQVIALLGPDQCDAVVNESECTCPTGVSISSNDDPQAPTLTISVTSAVTQPGKVTIPVHVNGGAVQFTLEFAFGIAIRGQNGTSVTVASTSVQYQASASGTETPTGAWLDEPPSVPAGQYLWTRTVVSYSDGKSTTSYSVSRQGVDGAAGADAITMVITSSAGLIFKNSNIETTLTAHVYRAGAEVTGAQLTALGTIRWYKDGGSTAVGTGASIEVSGSDVVSTATYVAQLEG